MRNAKWFLGVLFLLACGQGSSSSTDDSKDSGTGDMASDDENTIPKALCLESIPADSEFDPEEPNPLPNTPDRLDEALAEVDLTRSTLVYTEEEWNQFPDFLRHDDFRLPFFDHAHDAPLRAPTWARALITRLDDGWLSDTPVGAAIHLAADRIGQAATSCETLPTATSLADALRALGAEGNLEARLADVPTDLAAALIPIVEAAALAAAARDEAFAAYTGDLAGLYEEAPTLILRHADGVQMNPGDPATWEFLARGMDYPRLYSAAASLALTIERADLARFAGSKDFDVNIQTPLGRVLISDANADVHESSSYRDPLLLLVDTGGDDTYLVPAGATVRSYAPIAVSVDLDGSDEYAYEEDPDSRDGKRLVSDEWGRFLETTDDGPVSSSMVERQGAARLGVGLLFDLGGDDDRYRSLRMSQGFGALGVGVLYDDGGNDIYNAEATAQGSALFGIGLLIDGGGDDTHASYTQSQGFAYVYGFGGLYDHDGDDAYLCDVGDPALGGDPLYGSPQLPGAGNSSFCQGAGWGRRDDFSGTYMSGGIGVLRDAAGNDRYQASVFGIGSAYWFGTGILDDEAGDDTYDGLWYVEGSGAHFALDVLRDGDGNDLYNANIPPHATSMGVGHDYTVSFQLDLGGDDIYTAPGLSLGSGNANGFGFLFNLGGNDTYLAVAEPTLGAGNLSCEVSCATGCGCDPERRNVKTVGVFIDIEGEDTYSVASKISDRNNSSWVNNRDPDPESSSEHGAGLDTSSGDVTLP